MVAVNVSGFTTVQILWTGWAITPSAERITGLSYSDSTDSTGNELRTWTVDWAAIMTLNIEFLGGSLYTSSVNIAETEVFTVSES